MRVKRFNTNPLISAQEYPCLGGNINGPSVIRAPDWIPNPMAKYYMYFAHHKGLSIRLAYAHALTGPWTVYRPGTLQLSETSCYGHIASPDVHVLEQEQLIKMYYHGPRLRLAEYKDDDLYLQFPMLGGQRTLVAYSFDAISFTTEQGILGSSYFRYFKWQGQGYAIGMPGIIYRQTGIRPDAFEQGPQLFGEDCRHFAVRTRESGRLECYFTRAGDVPERILFSSIDLSLPWSQWAATDSVDVLRPEVDYEGTSAPLRPSERGAVHGPAQQLRDPCIFQDQGRAYLFYALAGEQGIGGATLNIG